MRAVRLFQTKERLTDAALAQICGVSQSSVSRALTRDPPVETPTLKIIYAYAITTDAGTSLHSRARMELSTAAMRAWDGTPTGLADLRSLLVHVANLGRRVRR